MASRAVGALLGLAAAGLIAVALATPSWWSGHPRVNGKTFDAKAAHIGLYGGTGCNTGGAGGCEALPLGGTYKIVAFGELGLGGIACVLLLLVGASALRGGERRKPLARVALPVLVLAALAGGALLVIGPEMHLAEKVEVPISWGVLVFWGGIAAGLLASLSSLAARPEPLRLKIAPQPAAPPAPAFDVRELLRDQHDALRPSALGPEPMLGPGGALRGHDGDPGGFAPPPLIEGAPQLRALYDAQGAGIVPAPPKPVLPVRAPTPVPRASVSALAGIPTPSAVDVPPVPRAEPKAIAVPSIAHLDDRPDSEPIEPPPPVPRPPLGKALPQLAKVPPPPSRIKPPSIAPLVPIARAPASAPSADRADRRSKPTISHAIPPPPTPDTMPPPPTLPAGQGRVRLPTDRDDRLEVALRETEAVTAVEIDAEAKAAAAGASRPEPATDQLDAVEPPAEPRGESRGDSVTAQLSQVGDRTDVGVEVHHSATMQTPPPVLAADEPPAAPEPEPVPAAAPAPAPAARPSAPQVPLSTAPASLPPPKNPQVQSTGPTPACPQCEAPMAWVEEHLRFYCRQCRMYF